MNKAKLLNMESVPKATSISICVCQDHRCGPHIVFWSGEEMLAHAPLSINHTRGVIQDLQEIIAYRTGPRQ